MNYTTDTPVPFSPIPTHIAAMKWAPEDDYAFDAAPMPKMWAENYRAAVIWRDRPERARYHGDLAMDLEDAYMTRLRNELKAGRR